MQRLSGVAVKDDRLDPVSGVLLVNRPLVMTYIISAASYNFAKYTRLIRPQLFSLPNILARERLIPELVQEEATAEKAEIRAV